MGWQEAVESGCDESVQPVFKDLMFQWLGGPLSKGESGLSAGNREDFRQVVGRRFRHRVGSEVGAEWVGHPCAPRVNRTLVSSDGFRRERFSNHPSMITDLFKIFWLLS